jgi:hypothetical protein
MRALAFGFLAICMATVVLAEPAAEWRLSPKATRDAVRGTVEAQIAALRAGKFAEAYELAASGIRRQFTPAVFAAMLKRGYPPIVADWRFEAGTVRDDRERHAQVVYTFIDARETERRYRYTLVMENGRWLVEGVVPALPDKQPSI